MAARRPNIPSSATTGVCRGPSGSSAPVDVADETLTAIATILGVTIDDVRALPTDQLRKWLNHPDTVAEIEAMHSYSPTQLQGQAAEFPPKMMATIAGAIGVTVAELRGATHDQLLAWLANPEHFYVNREPPSSPDAVAFSPNDSEMDPARYSLPPLDMPTFAPYAAAAPERTEPAPAPVGSSLQRFRDLRRDTLQSRLSDRPEVMNWLLGRIEEVERSEDQARSTVRAVPSPRRPSSCTTPRDSSTPDVKMMRNARAAKSPPLASGLQQSLLGKLASGLGGLFKRSGGNKNTTRPPQR